MQICNAITDPAVRPIARYAQDAILGALIASDESDTVSRSGFSPDRHSLAPLWVPLMTSPAIAVNGTNGTILPL